MSSATNFSTNRLNLTGFTTYFFSVRGECEGDGGGERQYGPASNGLRIKTPSRGIYIYIYILITIIIIMRDYVI